jgi:hypothetical protein
VENRNAILSAQNKQISQLADTATSGLRSFAGLRAMDTQLQRQAAKEYNDNLFRVAAQRLGISGPELEYRMRERELQEQARMQKEAHDLGREMANRGNVSNISVGSGNTAASSNNSGPYYQVDINPNWPTSSWTDAPEDDGLVNIEEPPIDIPTTTEVITEEPNRPPLPGAVQPTFPGRLPNWDGVAEPPAGSQRDAYEHRLPREEVTAWANSLSPEDWGRVKDLAGSTNTYINPREAREVEAGDIIYDQSRGTYIRVRVRDRNGRILWDVNNPKHPSIKDINPDYARQQPKARGPKITVK